MSAPSSNQGEPPDPDGEPALFTASSTLLLMLVVFAVLAMLSLMSTMGRPRPAAHHSVSNVAYRPADFPEVFDEDPLEGLAAHAGEALPVPPPPFRIPEDYPCSQCHEGDPGDPRRRELGYHEEIVLDHDEENRWCLDCHMAEDRDVLHAADGSPITFEESYKLCGQCHGTRFRDWRAGVHGRRTGYWDGPRRYLLCVHCHDPHSPAFEPIRPLPPPVMPDFLGEARAPEASNPEDGL